MHTLFLRIFLSFWLAMIVIAGLTVAAILIHADGRLEELESVNPPEVIHDAARTLEHAGPDGLRDWLQDHTHAIPGVLLYIIDDHGRDLLNRELPPELMRRINRHDARHLHLPRNYRPPRFMPRFVGPDGREYSVLMAPHRSGPLGLLGFGRFRFLILAIALVVSAIVCYFLARYISRPVQYLQTATHRLAAGDLDTRVGGNLGRRRDELAVLAHDFDNMAEQLRVLITSRQQLLRDLSHELRSPLTRLRLALGLAARKGKGAEGELDRIEREAERLEKLIGQILELARLDQGQSDLRLEQADLAVLIDMVVQDARFEGKPKGCRINWQSGAKCDIDIDEDLMRSAIENVVRNAVRYTADKSSVDIDLTTSGPDGDIVLRVRDRGPGVPNEELSRIFEPFHRVAKSRDRGSGGEGIGLAIAKRVVNLHGGNIEARNAQDGGLEVTIMLPAAAQSRLRAEG